MKWIFVVCFLGLRLTLFAHNNVSVDVCIYGGTSAGVIAAYTAKKMGKSVLLIEPGKNLGGLSSGGLGFTDIGNKSAITGLALDFYRRIGQHYGKLEQWIFEPHVAEDIFRNYIKTAQVPVLFGRRIIAAKKDGQGYLRNIVVEEAAAPARNTNKTIEAKVFIDCSYEGDLMARAGVTYFVGREDNKVYNETISGVQLHNKHQFPDGVDPYKVKADPASGLLWGISPAKLAPAGSGDKMVQAYNYRICLTNDPANRRPITKPENYDASRYELLLRLFDAQPDKRSLGQYFAWSLMPNHKTDINNNGAFSTDMIGYNHNYPEAGYAERRQIIKQHEDYTKGLLYFVGNDPRVPDTLRRQIKQWGYPKDEYRNNNNWSPQPYIREARRMIGSYVMTEHNCWGKEVVEDGVGMAAYTMDSHNAQRLVVNGMVKNEGDVQVGGFGPYPIAYRSLVPKREECKNLLVPVCLSASHMAFGSIRMEPVFMVLGQSAAVAASMAIDNKIPVQEVNVTALQRQLKTNPFADGRQPDLLVDNDDTAHVQVAGNWIKDEKAGGRYGKSLLYIAKNERGRVRFLVPVPKTGYYRAYVYYPQLKAASATMPVVIFNGRQSVVKTLMAKNIVVEGQTSGEWVNLGDYEFTAGTESFVEISAENTDGQLAADAVLLVKIK